MTVDLNVERDAYACARKIEEGLGESSIDEIEQGLSLAYDLFVNYVLEDRCESLLALGRNLNAAYFPYRSQLKEPDILISSYHGQIRSLINLCDYISKLIVPQSAWLVVGKSKYAKSILQALLADGAMLATDLCERAGIIHKTQLSRTILPLMDEGLVRQERFGKNIWYSLTSTGKLMTAKHFGAEEARIIESVLPVVILELQGGWHTIGDLIDNLKLNIAIPTMRSLVLSIISALQEAGIVEERAGNWRIIPNQFGEVSKPSAVSINPDLKSAAAIVAEAYKQFRVKGVVEQDRINEARNILHKLELSIIESIPDQHATNIRIAIERSKCAALEGNWTSAVQIMHETEVLVPLLEIDQSFHSAVLDRELETVWSYIQDVSIDSLVKSANGYIARRDYNSAKDIITEIYTIYSKARRPLADTNLLLNIIEVALQLSKAAGSLQREQDRINVRAFEMHISSFGSGEWDFPDIAEIPSFRGKGWKYPDANARKKLEGLLSSQRI